MKPVLDRYTVTRERSASSRINPSASPPSKEYSSASLATKRSSDTSSLMANLFLLHEITLPLILNCFLSSLNLLLRPIGKHFTIPQIPSPKAQSRNNELSRHPRILCPITPPMSLILIPTLTHQKTRKQQTSTTYLPTNHPPMMRSRIVTPLPYRLRRSLPHPWFGPLAPGNRYSVLKRIILLALLAHKHLLRSCGTLIPRTRKNA